MKWESVKNDLLSEKRSLSYLPIHFNLNQLFQSVHETVPAPEFPDPNELPVPEPMFHQVLTKPQERSAKKVSQNFTILTPAV